PEVWDVDTREADAAVSVIGTRVASVGWDDWFTSGRGLEVGRDGIVERCAACGATRSLTRQPVPCRACGSAEVAALNLFRADGAGIPVCVGEDVRRHRLSPSRSLARATPGVDLKTELDPAPRLLVRKTGLGI